MRGLTPIQQQEAAKDAVHKVSQKDQAEKFGVDRQAIRTFQNSDHGKELISRAADKIYSKLDDICQIVGDEIDLVKTIPAILKGEQEAPRGTTKQELLQFKSLANGTIQGILKGAGILPSNAPALHIQNIYNDHRKQIIDPQVLKAIGGSIAQQIEGPEETIQTVEFKEITE